MKIRAKCWECLTVQDHGVKESRGNLFLRARCNKCRQENLTPEQRARIVWQGMKARCHNKKCKEYRWYGARGIKVCPRWRMSFKRFLEDMGPVPFRGASIERVDNDGDYRPGNCAWIERAKQSHNQRSNKLITFNGETLHLAEWARRTGVERRALGWRLKAGWSVEDALTTPVRILKPRA